MAVCAFVKPSGDRCRAQPMRGEQWCYVHHPDLKDRRAANSRRGGRRGGRGRPVSDIAGVKAQLQEMADKVLCGELDRADASVAGQLLNIKLRCLETERKILETVELEERLATLEAMAPYERGGDRHGRSA